MMILKQTKEAFSPNNSVCLNATLIANGLINAGTASIEYLSSDRYWWENTANWIKYGASLGVGLAAMGTHRMDVYEQLKHLLYQDDAVTGEAAGLSIGLVMLGSAAPAAIHDLVACANETQSKKSFHSVAIGIALLMFGRLMEADTLIETLCRDKDPIKRRSGVHTVAMAYCGTGNNEAMQKLMNVAVSDKNDDVRRAAVEAFGFILFRMPEKCSSVVSHLSKSCNPNVRYGSAMALGISCAGTGSTEALGILEPLTNDKENFVRQGAFIASSLVLIQQTENLCPKVKRFRDMYKKVIDDKHECDIAKFGAILAQGIIDAGGRNTTISLQSHEGHTNIPAVVGLLVFTQYWYCFPLAHFIALAITPTALIGLNENLMMPKMDFKFDVSPSLFAYPESLIENTENESVQMEGNVAVEKDKVEDQKGNVPEPTFTILPNPARVMPDQLKLVSIFSSRYIPVKKPISGGIILLKDKNPSEAEQLVTL